MNRSNLVCRRRAALSAAAAALSAAVFAGAVAAPPTLAAGPRRPRPQVRFEKIADSRDGVFTGFGTPAINDAGTVAFGAWSEADVASGIFTSRGGGDYHTVVLSGDRDLVAFGPPSINNSGTVAFEAVHQWDGTSDSGVWVGSGRGDLRAVATSEDGSPIFAFGLSVRINDWGTVVFHAHRTLAAGGGQGVFVGEAGGVPRAVATTADYPEYAAFGASPDLNNWGRVAFTADRAPAAGGGRDILVGSAYSPAWFPVPPVVAFSSQGPGFGGFGSAPSLNDWGLLGFSAAIRGFTGAAPVGVFLAAGPDQIANIAATNQEPFTVLRDPVVNDRGTAAFFGFSSEAAGGGVALFAKTAWQDAPVQIIARGDRLFGRKVKDLRFFRGLNDGDQIVFGYELENGAHGIARADLR